MTEIKNEIEVPRDIMHYQSDVWEVADLLLSAGIKQSDFPSYMMPFFALMMLEGRMRNAVKKVEEEYGFTAIDNPADFKEAYDYMDCGFNKYIVMEGKTLESIAKNDSTFNQDFGSYLSAFDPTLKKLLGVDRGKNEAKFLRMDEIAAELRNKGILCSVAGTWAKIDLSAYSNSDITTLEEHIKRKWADISASTAGEQYTPDDIISLIAEIVASKVTKPKSQIIHVYDPTCGGANLLFGVSDRLQKAGYENIDTSGSEYNDALYALAAIESRFRPLSQIHYGNTLTTNPFDGSLFDVVVANPPYGSKWSGFEKEIKGDQLGQFPGGLPSISDGQLLFMQHILSRLDSNGIAVEVHDGSTLFSGNAGTGENNIRKYIFDHDWVEAIIQMPQSEFFNTGIYTYLWIMNKNKPAERKDKVALIDGSSLWQLLKKTKGNKRREMNEQNRKKIVDTLTNFQPNEICKIFDREYFYYNTQNVVLTEISENGKHVEQTICKDGKAFTIKKPKKLTLGDKVFDSIKNITNNDFLYITARLATENGELPIKVETEDDGAFEFVPTLQTIIHYAENRQCDELGCGQFKFKTTKNKNGVEYKITIEPWHTDDYEIIPYHFNEIENKREIDAFMSRYVFKPYELGKDIIGVALNFNKEFYFPEKLDNVDDILKEICALNASCKEIDL